MIKWLKWFFGGHREMLKTLKDQQELIEKLNTKEVFTVLQPPRTEHALEDAAELSQIADSRALKWIFYEMELATVGKIKKHSDIETLSFCRGALAMIDLIHGRLQEISVNYKATKVHE